MCMFCAVTRWRLPPDPCCVAIKQALRLISLEGFCVSHHVAQGRERCVTKTAVGLAILCILVLHRHVNQVAVLVGICEHQVLWPLSHAIDLLLLAEDGGAGAGASCFLLFAGWRTCARARGWKARASVERRDARRLRRLASDLCPTAGCAAPQATNSSLRRAPG